MRKKVLFLTILVVVSIFVLAILGVRGYLQKKNEDEIEAAIHGVVIGADVPFYAKADIENVKQIRLLDKGENVYILDEFEKNNIEWYKIKVNKKTNRICTCRICGLL